MKKGFRVMQTVAVTLIILLFFNCATIIRGTNQQIEISSNPISANVKIDGLNFGKTPTAATLSRSSDHFVEIGLEGFSPYQIILSRKLDVGWVFGSIVWGPIGIGIDAISGALFKLTPSEIQAELQKSTTSLLIEDDKIYIAVFLNPKSTWEKFGQLESSN